VSGFGSGIKMTNLERACLELQVKIMTLSIWKRPEVSSFNIKAGELLPQLSPNVPPECPRWAIGFVVGA